MDIIKICNGRIETTAENLAYHYFEKGEKFIAAYRSVYQVFYSKNAGWYTQKIGYFPKDNGAHYVPITLKGRHCFGNAEYINRLVSCENWLVD